jgi:ABC-2 type transport system permease protein
MSELSNMVWVEALKAVKSRLPLYAALGSLFMPLGVGFLIFAATHPDLSRKLGLLGAKANLTAFGATDWPSYLVLTADVIAAGGFIVFCLVASWVFGREFADRTVTDLLAVPVRRGSILLAKFIVVAIWNLALAAAILAASLVMGALIGLRPTSPEAMLRGVVLPAATACLVILVTTPFVLLASIGRGYLLPLGAAILALIMANLVAVAGWGEYFPWSVPGLFAQGNGYLAPVSGIIVVLTGLAGVIGTYVWWRYADQSM